MKNLIFAFAFLLLTIPCSAEIIIVDEDWPYDFNNIQAAIDYSSNGDFIFVFPGTYTGSGNRDIDFSGKIITLRSIDPTDPYIVAETIIDCNGIGRGFNFTSGEDANSVLAGFTITNGYGSDGGGIYCNHSSPTITNCSITGNSAGEGGGIYCLDSSPTIINCSITGNSAGEGAGIFCGYDSSPTIINCSITGNSAEYDDGGGIYCDYEEEGNPIITNCIISGNTANRGGGIYCGNILRITNCAITGNSAERYGGGIYCSSSLRITNCTIADNSAEDNGGGIFSGWSLFVTSSIVWGNTDNSGQGQSAQIYDDDGPIPDVSFSCIQDDNPNDVNVPFGEEQGNIDDDPCFVEPGTGYWDDNNTPADTYDDFWVWLDGDYHLLFASPCIETGNPYFICCTGNVDMDGQPRLMGQRVDMGADEFEIAMIVVTKPQGGEVWAAGSTHEINWASWNISGTVDIYYSSNSGTDWVMIENSVTDTGNFIWHLPSEVDSNQCLVLVEPNTLVPNLICIESGLFAIYPDFIHPTVPSKWKSLGGDFDRAGLSQNYGPELGCVKWQFQTNGPVSASPTIGAGDRVHIACEDGKLYTLDPDGSLVWTYDVNSPLLSSPSVGPSGSVYVGSQDGKLYAISITGRLRWTHSTDGFISSSPAVSADGNVYACSQDGTLYALGQDGSELWSFETAGSGVVTGAIFASPAIGPNNTVYIAGLYDPNLYALDSNDGSVKWNCTFLDSCELNGKKPWPFASPVIAADGTIYISLLFDPNLYAIDSNDASLIWSVDLADPCSIGSEGPNTYCWSEPALGPDGTIYVSFDDPYLRAVNPNGTIRWVTRLGVMGGFTLTVGSDGLIYAASDDAYLCVIDPDGEEIARFKGDDWLSFPVITADNTMIVSDANNTVWAIGDVGCEGQAAALHRPQDLSTDWAVNFKDFALVANDWLKLNCFALEEVPWEPPCEQYPDDGFYYTGDIDRDLYVDFADLAELANRWLTQE